MSLRTISRLTMLVAVVLIAAAVARRPRRVLFERRDDLLLGEPRLPHQSSFRYF
jgi:hypothetical protein